MVYSPAVIESRRFERAFTLVSLLFSVVLYPLGLFLFFRSIAPLDLPGRAYVQVAVSVMTMTIAAVIAHIHRSWTGKAFAMVVQALLILLISQLSLAFVWIRYFWLIPMVLQFSLFLRPVLYYPVSIAFVAAVLVKNRPVRAWEIVLSPVSIREITALTVGGLALVSVAGLLRVLRDWYREQERLVENLKMNIVKLTNANFEFQTYANAAEETARRTERLTITRELHDSIGYTMTTLRMVLEAGKDLIADSPLKLEIQLEKALDLVTSGYKEVREALHVLRGQERESPSGLSGMKALMDLFGHATGVTVAVNWGNIPQRLPPPIESAVYRFLQEGMSNALSHGNATEIRISFRHDGDELVVGIADNGIGADQIIEGIGIAGMKERMQELGGTLRTLSMKLGFLVEVRLPLREAVA